MRLAYAWGLLERQAAGEPVRLVVLALHDWSAGKWIADRPGVVRLVLPPDSNVIDAEVSVLFGLDVLLIGGEPDAADLMLRLVLAAGAASAWGEYDDGLWRVVAIGRRGLLATVRVPHADALLDALPPVRLQGLLTREGVLGSEMFREARLAAVGEVFGAAMAERLRAREAERAAA